MKTVLKNSSPVFLVIVVLWLAGCQTSKKDPAPIVNSEPTSFFGDWQPIEDQYIVVYSEESNLRLSHARTLSDFNEKRIVFKEVTNEILMDNQLPSREINQVFVSALEGFSTKFSPDEREILMQDSRIAFIEQDQFIPFAKPPWAGGGNDGSSGGQETPWGITRVNGGVEAAGKTAWIIDTGVDLDHPDLNVDVNRSRTFVSTGRDSKNADDKDGHGTHVAGTIAAIDNNIGVVGIAAGATVVAVKVLGPFGGTLSDVIAGIDYVGNEGSNSDIANLSLGGGASTALDQAVVNASNSGVKFVIAAGNDGDNANRYSPARANGNNIYTISAMGKNDIWASFSNYANPPIDYCAPGVSILSTYKGGGYAAMSGTSMAAPHAAGVLLLGGPSTDGTVNGDPDGNADPIIVH